MKKVTEESFRPYGRVLNLDVADFVKVIVSRRKTPHFNAGDVRRKILLT